MEKKTYVGPATRRLTLLLETALVNPTYTDIEKYDGSTPDETGISGRIGQGEDDDEVDAKGWTWDDLWADE